MARVYTGGPAFPVSDQYGDHAGITVRDYFAAIALHACATGQLAGLGWKERSGKSETDALSLAAAAYEMADMMLAVRARE